MMAAVAPLEPILFSWRFFFVYALKEQMINKFIFSIENAGIRFVCVPILDIWVSLAAQPNPTNCVCFSLCCKELGRKCVGADALRAQRVSASPRLGSAWWWVSGLHRFHACGSRIAAPLIAIDGRFIFQCFFLFF
jgi:hypothetical protein